MKLLNMKQAAASLSISTGGLYALRRLDLSFPKPIRRGKGKVFIEDDLLAWQEARYGAQRRENAERLKVLQRDGV